MGGPEKAEMGLSFVGPSLEGSPRATDHSGQGNGRA